MKSIAVLFCLYLGICTGTWAKAASTPPYWPDTTTTPGSRCTGVFEEVGNHCIFVDKDLSGTWQDMRDVCHVLGGDLVNLQDANFLADIKDYLYGFGHTGVTYWVGSNDQVTEGVWQWINDHSQVKLGTPLWGDLSSRIQEPTGGSAENCGVLFHGDHYFMHDTSCSVSYSLICEQYNFHGIEVTGTNASRTDIVQEDSPNNCPSPYVIVAGRCIFVNTLAKNSWQSHKTSCESLGGYMVKLDDANFLGAIFDYLTQSGISHEFWIGASDDHQEGQWFWHDGSRVRMGTPFWGDNGTITQNPDGGVTENCGMINYDDHYFFDDEDCNANHYVICETT
ncbi:C-type mannose receptor 2-like isoform X1 [Palaemon carinicauda]|uniref:C-type mannose receptor 2-like isoform X1 n=1 Tax=Palaemon carinicauda TaxID=392227 RepID=UPI0035B58588